MSAEIIAILDNLAERFGVAVDWSSEYVIPYLQDLVQRLVRYELSISVALLILFPVISVVLFLTARCCHTKNLEYKRANREDNGALVCGFAVAVGFSLVSACASLPVAIKQIIDIIACMNFPEKIIMAYLQEFSIL